MNQNIFYPIDNNTLIKINEHLAKQRWSVATLYVVATPIGNLGDLSLRAWQALTRVDIIACEDIRVSQVLLNAWAIQKPLITANRHNEKKIAKDICAVLKDNKNVALISDAGSPTISDPGSHIVNLVRQSGYKVIPIPGTSAINTALMGSGITTDKNPMYIFAGFIPSKSTLRIKWLHFWCVLPAPILLFESPNRLAISLKDLFKVCGPERLITIGRELTKRFEEIKTFPLSDYKSWLDSDLYHRRGEYVLIIHAPNKNTESVLKNFKTDYLLNDQKINVLLDILLETISIRDATKIVTKVTGFSHKKVYNAALSRKYSI